MRKPDAVFLFEQEVREKKADRRNYYKKTGSRGRGGKMYLPADLMNRADKKKHTKAGEVEMSNMYDTILNKDEFDVLENHEKRNHMQYWRAKYPIKDIQNGMKISYATYKKYIEELELPMVRAPRKAKAKTRKKKVKPATKELPVITPPEQLPTLFNQDPEPEPPQQAQVIVLNGLNIAYNGIYNSTDIQRMFSKLDLLLEGEDSQFEVELNIKERKKDKKK